MALIYPSVLALDFSRLGEGLEAIRRAGASAVHIDVCDGHFAPGITAGVPIITRLRQATALRLDVHLRVERPERFVAEFISAGADRVSVHPESTSDVYRVVQLIRSQGAEAGAALNPATPVLALQSLLMHLDFVSILSGEPGGVEGSFFLTAIEKVRAARDARDRAGARFTAQVEGKIDLGHVHEFVEAGAGILVPDLPGLRYPELEKRLREMIIEASKTGESIAKTGSRRRE